LTLIKQVWDLLLHELQAHFVGDKLFLGKDEKVVFAMK
jgi:hypothetical protein